MRQDHSQDQCSQRRVRTQNENAAPTEYGLGEQRNNGCIKAIDTRQSGCLGVRNADRDKHGGHDETGYEVISQPGQLVVTKSDPPRKPAGPASLIPLHSRLRGAVSRFVVRRSIHGH